MAFRLYGAKPFFNQHWLIVNWTPGNNFHWKLNRNSIIFIKKMHFKMLSAKMAAILSRGRWVNSVGRTQEIPSFILINIWSKKCFWKMFISQEIMINFCSECCACWWLIVLGAARLAYSILAPVPLTVFRLNSKFDKNLECANWKYAQPIARKFCTRHDSYTVVTCAKFCCDRQSTF